MTEVIPTTPPPAVKTGPPALPDASLKSDTMACGSTRLTVPDVRSFCSRSGTPIVKSFWPSTTGGFAACAHPSGTDRNDAATLGSIQRTATSLTGSAARTLAATLTAGESCTSTDVAVPMTRWFVAMSPFASIRNPDAWVLGVHRATTLSCH